MAHELAIWKPQAALACPANIELVVSDKHDLSIIMDAFPGDLTADDRRSKAMQLLAEAKIHIETAKCRDLLLRCVGASIVDSLVSLARMDLSLASALGEAYLVPFNGVCTLMVGYRGFIKLIVNTGLVKSVESVLVYEGDTFDFTRDETGPHWKHKPALSEQGDVSKIVGCYMVGYTGAVPIFEYMNKAELMKVKASSKAVQSGKPSPYTYWETEMLRKAPIRRAQKYLPKTGESPAWKKLEAAMTHDNTQYDLDGYRELRAEHAKEVRQLAESGATDDVPPEKPKAPDNLMPSDLLPAESDEYKNLVAKWKNAYPGTTAAQFRAWCEKIAGKTLARKIDWTMDDVARCAAALPDGPELTEDGHAIPPEVGD